MFMHLHSVLQVYNVINILIIDVLHQSGSYLVIRKFILMTQCMDCNLCYLCISVTAMCISPPPPQFEDSEFVLIQSNTVVHGTEDWEMVEEDGPSTKDHLPVNQSMCHVQVRCNWFYFVVLKAH